MCPTTLSYGLTKNTFLLSIYIRPILSDDGEEVKIYFLKIIDVTVREHQHLTGESKRWQMLASHC